MDEQEHELDPTDEAFVRALLADVGREPEPLPGDVAARLDSTLAGLVGERALDDPAPPAVVPLDRARQRRRRGLQTLVAAAAVVVGGYTVTTTGILTAGGGSNDSAGGSATSMEGRSDAGSSGGDAAPGDADSDAGFPMASGSLRADARRLVSDGTAMRSLSNEYFLSDRAEVPTTGETARTPDLTADKSTDGLDSGAEAVPRPQGASRCLDPLVPARLTRLAVTYDGRAATAVLRPVRDAPDGARRVRVEVWDCAAPVRLAAVVVRR